MKEFNHLYYSKKATNENERKIRDALAKGESITSLYQMGIKKEIVVKILLFLREKENHFYDDDGIGFDEWCKKH